MIGDASPTRWAGTRGRCRGWPKWRGQSFDGIVYVGHDADVIEQLGPLLAPLGVLDIVLAGGTIGRGVPVDVGRVHYDLIRYTGDPGASAAAGYDRIPSRCELRPGEEGGDREGRRSDEADAPPSVPRSALASRHRWTPLTWTTPGSPIWQPSWRR
ncbi:MAG: hypothetical protein IPL43_16040 [Micropruina sp.]|nr:hypothetical protein [Micropruina sp.]